MKIGKTFGKIILQNFQKLTILIENVDCFILLVQFWIPAINAIFSTGSFKSWNSFVTLWACCELIFAVLRPYRLKKNFRTLHNVLKSPDLDFVPLAYHLHDTLSKLFQCVSYLKVIAWSWDLIEAFEDLRSPKLKKGHKRPIPESKWLERPCRYIWE